MSPGIVFDWCLVVGTVIAIGVLSWYVLVEERRYAGRRIGDLVLDVPTVRRRGPEDDPAWLAYTRGEPGGRS